MQAALAVIFGYDFSNFGSLKSTETRASSISFGRKISFSNFGSLKSTETIAARGFVSRAGYISAISAR